MPPPPQSRIALLVERKAAVRSVEPGAECKLLADAAAVRSVGAERKLLADAAAVRSVEPGAEGKLLADAAAVRSVEPGAESKLLVDAAAAALVVVVVVVVVVVQLEHAKLASERVGVGVVHPLPLHPPPQDESRQKEKLMGTF